MATKIKTVTTTVDDLTGRQISSGGWELRGRVCDTGTVYHFQSLTNLTEALLDTSEVFGVSADYIRQELSRREVIV